MKKIIILLLLCLFLSSSFCFAGMDKIKPIKTSPDNVPLIGIFPASYTDAIVLVPNTPIVYSVPTGAVYTLINCTSSVWVRFGGVAAIPSTNITDGSASVLNPALRAIPGVTSIGFVSSAACICSIDLWNK
jgi:hypothetical protein